MAYEMGVAGVLGFHDMLRACQAGDWSGAAAAGLDSDWARKEAPARAERLMAMLRNGK
jgi:lysozyme